MSQARSRWLRQPDPTPLPRMRNAARLSGSELVRYLGPGRTMEVTDPDPLGFSKREWDVWKVLAGRDEFDEDERPCPGRSSAAGAAWRTCLSRPGRPVATAQSIIMP